MYVRTENEGPSFSVSKTIARTDSQTDRHTDKPRETDSTEIITYPAPADGKIQNLCKYKEEETYR